MTFWIVFYFLGAQPKNQGQTLTFCYHYMLNVEEIILAFGLTPKALELLPPFPLTNATLLKLVSTDLL
jgi:hypothetical protein